MKLTDEEKQCIKRMLRSEKRMLEINIGKYKNDGVYKTLRQKDLKVVKQLMEKLADK